MIVYSNKRVKETDNMLTVKVDKANGIALLEPDGPLSKEDFESAVKIIDPFIEKNEHLNGLIIHTESFPGWDSFAALSSHLKFNAINLRINMTHM